MNVNKLIKEKSLYRKKLIILNKTWTSIHIDNFNSKIRECATLDTILKNQTFFAALENTVCFL